MEEQRTNNEIEEVRNEDLYEQEYPIQVYENDINDSSSKPLLVGLVGGVAALAVGGVLLWKRHRNKKKKGKNYDDYEIIDGELETDEEESEKKSQDDGSDKTEEK